MKPIIKKIVHWLSNENVIAIFISFILIALVMFILSSLVSSCTVTKSKSNKSIDSTAVKKSSATELSINSGGSTNQNEWFRNTYLFPGRHDTTTSIQTVLQPIYNNSTQPAPTVIIQEGGKIQASEWHYNYDSANHATIDSVKNIVQTISKDKKTEVLNIWQIIGLCAGVCLVFQLLTKFKITYKRNV